MGSTEVHDSLKELQAKGIDTTLSFRSGPRLVPKPDEVRKNNGLGFDYAEHDFLGDTIYLDLGGSKPVLAGSNPFTLPNTLRLTYGQIVGLGGDFYGTYQPVSDGTSPKDQRDRFTAAYDTLAQPSSWQPKDAQAILKVLQNEKEKIDEAYKNRDRDHIDPSKVYSELPDENDTFAKITLDRPTGVAGYVGLLALNWDHFGPWARTTYNAGHYVALQVAAEGKGDLERLKTAYAMNAFADHFLTDSFSAGHMRTPRRQLHRFSEKLPIPTDADLCSMYMHNEDNAIGLDVVNPRGERWTAYGDARLLDHVNDVNREKCVSAVQVSANEVFNAWKTGKIQDPTTFKAWEWAPILDEVRALKGQALAPLFTFEDTPRRRSDITKRRAYNFTKLYTYLDTIAQIKWSGLWNYPITLGLNLKEAEENLEGHTTGSRIAAAPAPSSAVAV